MGRPLAVVAAGLTLLAGINLVLSADRALSGSESGPTPNLGPAVVALPSSPPATVPVTTVPTAIPAPSEPPPTSSPPVPLVTPAAPAPEAIDPPPPSPDAASTVPATTSPPLFLAATVPTRGIGCAAEPFASAFTRSGFTPTDVGVGSCEIVLDIPGRVPSDQVCAQVSGPPVARSIHVAQRTVDGECRRDPQGVVIHEIGHAWHLADPSRFYRVVATFGLDPRAESSLEIVAECFVEAVGYLDTDCGAQGVAYVRAEMDASRPRR